MEELKTEIIEKVILVAVQEDGAPDVEASLLELRELAKTAGAKTVGIVTQKLEHAHPGTYIGKGKIDNLSKGDIVGFLCKKGNLKADEIGRIDVKSRYAYVAIRREKLQQVLRLTKGEKIKSIRTIIEPVK